jgi:eukaryotic-like serine/threonine-protein kinase
MTGSMTQAMGTDAWRSPSQQLGKYQLVATLGQGGMGTVYLALASGFGEFRKLLVLKELRQDLIRQEGFVSMFMDEARLAARLSHPNVVQTFEASAVGNRYFLAMEYLDGQSLSTLLDRTAKPLSAKLSRAMHIQILCEALEGLHYAHGLHDYDGSSLQVVHRDVSPQNVFVTYHGQVKVVDFGVAKVANASVKTMPGMFVGKFSYAAPEQVLGDPVDARTDVFAVGVMLWEAIAGRPFSDQIPTPAACRARSLGLEPRIDEVAPDVDPDLARICNRALAVNPDDRFSSAKEFRAELQEFMAGAGVRVEASEIGQLMHEVFDAERRSLHASIEQAMRNTGVGHVPPDNRSIFQMDKVPTAVADLSSLVEVSLEIEDHKIQQGYAHSKVTLLEPSSEQKRGIRMPTFIRMPRNRLLAFSAVGLVALVGVIWAFASDDSPPAPRIPPSAPSIAVAPQQPQQQPVAAQPEITSQARTGAIETSVSAATDSRRTMPETATRTSRKTRSEAPPPSAAMPSRLKTRATPSRTAAPVEPAERAPTVVVTPEPVASKRRLEEGADLTFMRRPTVQIDRESPYE